MPVLGILFANVTIVGRLRKDAALRDLPPKRTKGQQQVRNIWTNVAVYNLNLWMHALVKVWAWSKSREQLVDRSKALFSESAE